MQLPVGYNDCEPKWAAAGRRQVPARAALTPEGASVTNRKQKLARWVGRIENLAWRRSFPV